MSHVIGAVRFMDGTVKWYEYDGTNDVCLSHLYDTLQELRDNWRSGRKMACQCNDGMEKVEIYTSYADGFSFPGEACKNCLALRGGSHDQQNFFECRDEGKPGWYREF